jgi:hypothetical protein
MRIAHPTQKQKYVPLKEIPKEWSKNDEKIRTEPSKSGTQLTLLTYFWYITNSS